MLAAGASMPTFYALPPKQVVNPFTPFTTRKLSAPTQTSSPQWPRENTELGVGSLRDGWKDFQGNQSTNTNKPNETHKTSQNTSKTHMCEVPTIRQHGVLVLDQQHAGLVFGDSESVWGDSEFVWVHLSESSMENPRVSECLAAAKRV